MTGLPWFKCFPQDLLNGMAGMPADERGVYISVLCLIYREGGPIRDDPRELAYNTGCTVRAWVKYRAALILHGKLFVVHDGCDRLMNERCEAELDASKSRSEKNSSSGSIGGKKTAEIKTGKSNENNVTVLATAKRTPSEGVAILDTDTEEERRTPDTPNGVSRPTKAKASKRVPIDWMPKPSHWDLGASEGFSPGEIERELSKFRDHEFRTPHTDWDATFRKWLMTAAEHRPRNARTDQPSAKLLARHQNYADSFAGLESVARNRAIERAGGG